MILRWPFDVVREVLLCCGVDVLQNLGAFYCWNYNLDQRFGDEGM